MNISQHPPAHSGNYTLGRTAKIDRVVIHIAEGSFEGTLAWFANPECNVSAHYTVAADGRVGQSVNERNTAWHSGDWAMNNRSIGIEHEGRQNPASPWKPAPAQIAATAELVAEICRRWSIPADREHIIGHSDVNPGRAARKNCPGAGWPWAEFLNMVNDNLKPPAAHQPDKSDTRTVRLFDPVTNKQVASGTLIAGTDKVYIPADQLKELRGK